MTDTPDGPEIRGSRILVNNPSTREEPIVLMPAGSANRQSIITMQRWIEPDVTTDLTSGR
jgi:hypothetical protein